MSQSLTFSVGIPTYNQAEYLEETILSLLHQSRPPDQIFVSDHFSTDSTPQIIDKYVRLGRLTAGKPPPGVNLTGQWQYTLSQLRGDWVTLLSSDDLARPNFCEVLMRGAERHPAAALVRAGWENINGQGEILSKEYLLSVRPLVEPPHTLLSQRHGPKVSFAAYALNRDALARSGPLSTAMESLADWSLFLQISPFGAFVYENEIISGYRIHQTDKFRLRLGMWLRDEQRIFSEVMPAAARHAGLTDQTWIEEASRQNFFRYLASASQKLSLEERQPFAADFLSWAGKVDGEDALARFLSGEVISTPQSWAGRLKGLARPLAQRLYAGLHHHA